MKIHWNFSTFLYISYRHKIFVAIVRAAAILVLTVAEILIGFSKNCARAAAEPGSLFNYAYATWVGTGYYKVADQQVYILRGNFSWTLSDYDEKNWLKP